MSGSHGALQFGDLVIDSRAWDVYLRGVRIPVTKTEFELLVALASRPRRVVANAELTAIVWGENWYGDEGNLAVHISKLRGKLGESGVDPRYIRTVRGVGYRFEPEAESQRSGAWVASGEDPLQPSVTLLIATDKTLQWVSPLVGGLLGWDPADLVGLTPLELAHPDDRPILLASRPALDAGEPLSFQARLRTAWNDYRDVIHTIRPILGADGKVNGYLAEWQPLVGSPPRTDLEPIVLTPAHTSEPPIQLTYDADFILIDIEPRMPISTGAPRTSSEGTSLQPTWMPPACVPSSTLLSCRVRELSPAPSTCVVEMGHWSRFTAT